MAALAWAMTAPAGGAPMAQLATLATLATAASLAAGCAGGARVHLGDPSPPLPRFDTPHILSELDSSFENDNPTLTADLLELYFTSNRDGVSTDVWVARRASAAATFDPPARVNEVSTPAFETSSAISADGLTLWWGSERAGGLGGLDIWSAGRASRSAGWSAPMALPAMSSAEKDVPRPPGQHQLVMPLASERDSPGLYRTWLSARADPSAPFGTPRTIPELSYAGRTTVDAFLTDDGLTLYFSSGPPAGPNDLYAAWRRSVAEPFSIAQPLADLNGPGDDRDPWLSPDGTLLFFSSDRGGVLNIYQATVLPAVDAGAGS
jgi:hypothetical protein